MLERPLDEGFLSFLVDRTQGNPFFLEQTILYLKEMNQLVLVNDKIALAEKTIAISYDIRAVLLARIDRLLPSVQETVQTAAVLGREFSLNVLRHMLANNDQIDSHVLSATRSTIWIRMLKLRYLFKHALLRDVAYQMQLQSRRQKLHSLAFDSTLALYQADLAPYYGELAYHAEQAQRYADALIYLEKVGDVMAELFQNELALDYYGRCQKLLDEDGPIRDPDYQVAILRKQAEVYRVKSE